MAKREQVTPKTTKIDILEEAIAEQEDIIADLKNGLKMTAEESAEVVGELRHEVATYRADARSVRLGLLNALEANRAMSAALVDALQRIDKQRTVYIADLRSDLGLPPEPSTWTVSQSPGGSSLAQTFTLAG